MIVITDGIANQIPLGTGCDADPTLFEPDLDTNLNPGSDLINRARDCVMYYAHVAAAHNVPVYVISLGHAADTDLLQAAADVTAHLGGQYFAGITPDDLDAVFEAIGR